MTAQESDIRYQNETIIRFDETGEPAIVYTASARVAQRLTTAGLKPYKTTERGGKVTGWWFSVPAYGIAVKPANKIVRIGVRRRTQEAQEGRTEAQGTHPGEYAEAEMGTDPESQSDV